MHIVYGGGNLGLMGSTAASAYMEGVRVLGVLPKPLAESKICGATIGDEFRAVNMQDRISHMVNNPMPLSPFQVVLAPLKNFAQLNIHRKPIGLLNVNGFFDGLISFINFSSEKGFISERAKRIIVIATTPEELIEKLLAFIPEPDPALAKIVRTKNFSMRKRQVGSFLSL
ncbi:hypothetical protein OROMI_032168 [Orobanche minor]